MRVYNYNGFTLIELSMVLMIIGLIAGGVFIGRDLIEAAAAMAQISQIEKYQAAVYAFETKYNNYLPGDIPDPTASNFGFQARGTAPGEGDGNGIIEGNCTGSKNTGFDEGCGELPVFWVDLNAAGLISEGIVYQGGYPSMTTATWVSGSWLNNWLPSAKVGNSTFVYLDSYNSTNYFTVSRVDAIGWTVETTSPTPGITVKQAYSIDSKIDDGLPQSGTVTACYVNANIVDHQAVWAAGGGLQGANGNSGFGYNCVPTTAATVYASTNCYDNNNVPGPQRYSLQNASAQNCALSFAFQ